MTSVVGVQKQDETVGKSDANFDGPALLRSSPATVALDLSPPGGISAGQNAGKVSFPRLPDSAVDGCREASLAAALAEAEEAPELANERNSLLQERLDQAGSAATAAQSTADFPRSTPVAMDTPVARHSSRARRSELLDERSSSGRREGDPQEDAAPDVDGPAVRDSDFNLPPEFVVGKRVSIEGMGSGLVLSFKRR